MPDINLLPWREALREERKQQFYMLLGLFVAVALLLSFLVQMIVGGQIDHQLARNAVLQEGIDGMQQEVREINELRTAKADMIDRMVVIKSLQTNRPEIVKLFDDFARAVPDGVYLLDMTVEGTQIGFEGRAESNNRVSSFMRRLSDTAKVTQPNLTRVSADRTLGEQGSSFSMTAVVDGEALEVPDEE